MLIISAIIAFGLVIVLQQVYNTSAVRGNHKPDSKRTEPANETDTMRRNVQSSYDRHNCHTNKSFNHGLLRPFYGKGQRLFVGKFAESRRHWVGHDNYLNALFTNLIDYETQQDCGYSWVMQIDWPTGKRGLSELRPGDTMTFTGHVDIYDSKGFDDYSIKEVENPLYWADFDEVMDVCADMGFHGPPAEYGNWPSDYIIGDDEVPMA